MSFSENVQESQTFMRKLSPRKLLWRTSLKVVVLEWDGLPWNWVLLVKVTSVVLSSSLFTSIPTLRASFWKASWGSCQWHCGGTRRIASWQSDGAVNMCVTVLAPFPPRVQMRTLQKDTMPTELFFGTLMLQHWVIRRIKHLLYSRQSSQSWHWKPK